MIAPENHESTPEESTGDEGPARAESGLTQLNDARLETLAVRRGWIKDRWPTHQPKRELINEITGRDDVTLAERTVLAAYELLEGSERAKGIGARLAVTMEGQNQADEHKREPDLHLHKLDNVIIELPAKEPIVDARVIPSNGDGNGRDH